jgi:LacI family transcriptional regulator, galactose operon repressor
MPGDQPPVPGFGARVQIASETPHPVVRSPYAGPVATEHRVEDIASQAQLSRATVDRVLHHRPGVSPRAVRAVEQAVLDLDRQQSQLRLGARTLVLDVVIQAPPRFSSAYREAMEAQLGSARPAAVRARFRFGERADVAEAVAVLDRVGSGGRTSHGVLLKAPDEPAVADAARRLVGRGIPVVTLVTDVHGSGRVAYVGLDNRSAGATAAYLVASWLGERPGDLLVTLSRSAFFGESERLQAFRDRLGTLAPGRRIVAITESEGLDATLRSLVEQALHASPGVVGVYSIGGGNRAIVETFAATGRPCLVHVAHDLDRDNLELLQGGSLSAVLHHDLHADARNAIRQVLRYHRLLPGAPTSTPANVQVVTPFNVPGRVTPW